MKKSDTDKTRGGKPRSGASRGPASGPRDGARPRFSKPRGEDRPRRDGDERPRFKREDGGDARPFRKPRPEGDATGGGERPYRARPPRRDDASVEGRPFRPRPPRSDDQGSERSFRKPRPEGGDRPRRFEGEERRPPRGDAPGEGRPFRPRATQRDSESSERPFRDRKPFGEKKSFGDKPFRSREGSEGRPPRGDRPDRPPRRFEGGDRRPPRDGDEKPFRKPRDEGSSREERAPRDEGRERPKRNTYGMRAERQVELKKPGTSGISAEGERIARVMARAGLCSRREAEDWIAEGRVAVNGAVITSPALDVTAQDQIIVDGKPLPEREATRLWLYHKPRGLVTTADDPEGRPTVFDHLPAGLPRVVSIGRLDINTEGLMLLTNDGGLSRVLAHPDTGWLRRYRVRVYGDVNQAQLDTLRDGIELDGVQYGPIIARLDRELGDNLWLTMDLREGKNREIKRVLEHLGCQVSRLIRVSFGPFQLGDLPESEAIEVRQRVLQDQLGPELSEEAGVYFDGPRHKHESDEEPEERPKRFDKRKPTQKRDLALMGDDPTLKVEREKVADRKGRAVKVERVVRVAEAERPRAHRGRDEGRDERPRGRRFDGDAPRGDRPFRDRPAGDRPPRGDRPFGDRPPRRDRPEGERSFRPREGGDSRPPRKPRFEGGDAPRGDRPFREKPFRAREDAAPRRERPEGERSFRERPAGDRPQRSDRPQRTDRPFGDRPPRGDKPFGDKPFGDRPPRRDRPEGDRPFRSGPRSDGPRRDGPGRDGPGRGGPGRGGPGRGGPRGGKPGGFGGKPGGGPRRGPRRGE